VSSPPHPSVAQKETTEPIDTFDLVHPIGVHRYIAVGW
jgi:hypothetical protein